MIDNRFTVIGKLAGYDYESITVAGTAIEVKKYADIGRIDG